MKRFLLMLLALCCVCGCALSESYAGMQVQVDEATLLIPQNWESADLMPDDTAIARYLDGDRKIALYSFADMTMDDLLQELMRRDDEFANVTTVMLGERMAVQFDWSTEGMPCLAVGDDTTKKQLWIGFSPVTDSELGLLVGEVAKSVAFR